MDTLTKCGYCCDLCKAYAPNIVENDQRDGLSKLWKACYDVNIPPEDIYCDGCKCQKEGAKLIDKSCPVRRCSTNEKIAHCGECSNYPCHKFNQRKGLSESQVEEKLNSEYDASQYDEYLRAYDNKTRLDEYKRNNRG